MPNKHGHNPPPKEGPKCKLDNPDAKPPRVNVDRLEGFINKYNADQASGEVFQRENLRIQRALCRATIGAFVAAALYAAIALGQWDTQLEYVHQGQRAYVIIDDPMFDGKPEPEKPFQVKFSVKNTAPTPALGIQVYFSQPEVRWDQPPVIPRDPQFVTGPFDLVANTSFTGASPRLNPFLSAEALAGIGPGGPAVYLYGVIKYRDVFKASHTTVFCSVYRNTIANAKAGFVHCPVNNHLE